MRLAALLLALLLAAPLAAEPISPATHAAVMRIADDCGVPRSVAHWLMVEESGWWKTGAWGNASAVNRSEPGGWLSKGLYSLFTKPTNIDFLISTYWVAYEETECFDIFNPIHNAKVALRYLADLHRQLGTWYRAACGYNAGASNVLSGDVEKLDKYARTRAYAKRIIEAREP